MADGCGASFPPCAGVTAGASWLYFRVRSVSAVEQRVRRMAWVVWVGLAGLLAVAMLSACGDGSTATPSDLPTAVPAPATSTATPTPVPPTSTPTPTLAPTAEPGVVPVAGEFDIDSDTLWSDLFDVFTADEQSCIRTELGDELLESALAMRVLAEGDTEEWMVSIFGCLAPETAAAIFFTGSTFSGYRRGGYSGIYAAGR